MNSTDLDHLHQFWFGELPEFSSFPSDRTSIWFGSVRDDELSERFLPTLDAAGHDSSDVALLSSSQQVALVVLLDQIPRSIFRGRPQSYAFDERARAVMRVATAEGMQRFKLIERAFLTICLAHSENLADQQLALQHYKQDIQPYAPPNNRFYEAGAIQTAKYLAVILRFGRFPHRNEILGRSTSAEEAKFLAENSMAPFQRGLCRLVCQNS